MSALPDQRPPRPGLRLLVRGGLAMLIITLLSAASVATAVLLEVKKDADIFQREQIPIPNIQGALDGVSAGGPQTILVLGSDRRFADIKAKNPVRSDTMMLVRLDPSKNATAVMNIPRDLKVSIPGHGTDKINAAYAYGGPALAIRTVKQFLGIDINHVVEVNFDNFPQLIDALGGITYKGGCVVSKLNGGFKNGGYTLRLPAGTHHIDGKQALALARTRKNECSAKDNDFSRARRQQKILAAIKGQVTSVHTFFKLPWVSWAAPRAIRTDMAGPSLLGLVGAELSSGGKSPQVLKPTGTVGVSGLTVDDATKRRAVEKFLAG
jgi:LCP family protein required for cell wall assembly